MISNDRLCCSSRAHNLLGIKDPDSAGARKVMRSSGRLTRTVALAKSEYKTWIVSALLELVSYEGW